MSTSQRARSGVPLDQRSALASVPGVPAWGAVAIAVGATFLGFVIDAARGTELTSAFACLYIIGTVAAVVLVRYRGLFTAMVQAPLILFVAVPLSYQYFTENPGTGVKDILLNVAIPLVNRFPLMLLGSVLAIAVGAARIFLKRQATHAPAGAATRAKRDRTKDKRASHTRGQSKDDRAREPEVRPRGAATAVPDPRGAEHNRTNESAERRRRSEPAGPSESRRARRERLEPQYDRPAADPYRPDRSASEPPRRPTPRPQAPRVPRPPEVDPYSSPRGGTPTSAHIPPHPVPQVRYRDRGDS
ncbi:DUF6542 domain-containing protein [Rhodococcus sovatensis]|uniref:DUF6542 domain-containing protein n=1 Tax=Rhodococcus sovatensis TaxID=1805840 RepID=A0ABZ2PG51_9NOCA